MTTCLFKQFARYYSPSWKTPQLESLVKKIKDHFVTKKKISQTQSSEIHANDEVIKPIEILSSIRKYALDHPERNHPIVISIACYLARELYPIILIRLIFFLFFFFLEQMELEASCRYHIP